MPKESQKAIDWRSLPKAKEAIDETYNLAFRIVQQMRVISCYRIEWGTLSSIACFEEEGPQKQIEYWLKLREEKADQLDQLLMQLESDTKQLQSLFSPLWDLLQAFAYEDLKDFVSGSRNWGRSAYPAIQLLQWEVNAWGLQCRSFYQIRGFLPIDSKLAKQCEELSERFPMTTAIESDLRGRLYAEQGKLIKSLPEAQALYVDANRTANPEAIEVGVIRQQAILDSLSKTQRSYVFCGRIWRKYSNEQSALIDKGERKRTREGVQIAECFPVAKENGWPDDQLEKFIAHAKEGIKKREKWTEFVEGSEGEKIPLKKFLS